MSRVSKPETKKSNANASELKKLLANPTQEISTAKPPPPSVAPPPDVIYTFTGSTAGAGSGEFHVYKHARHKEAERLKYMNEAAQKDTDREEFLKRRDDQAEKDAVKTSKNRARRQKRKQGQAKGSPKPEAKEGTVSEVATEASKDAPEAASSSSVAGPKPIVTSSTSVVTTSGEPEPEPEHRIIDADAAF